MKIIYQTSAGGIVFKKTANGILWFTTQHSQHKGWTFPKGLVGDKEKGESKETAALREVQEEGGIKTKIVEPAPVSVGYAFKFEGVLIKKTVYYFLMEYVSGDPKDHDWEVSDTKFLPEEEMKKILTFKTDREAFEKILLLKKHIHSD